MTIAQRFWSKVAQVGNVCECWIWMASKNQDGYGRFWFNGITMAAHRVAYELAHGAILPGLQVDHLCRDRSCVNPSHLEPVTLKENVLRGEGITALNHSKDRCKRGHSLAGKNLRVEKSGDRSCRRCGADRQKQYRQRTARACS